MLYLVWIILLWYDQNMAWLKGNLLSLQNELNWRPLQRHTVQLGFTFLLPVYFVEYLATAQEISGVDLGVFLVGLYSRCEVAGRPTLSNIDGGLLPGFKGPIVEPPRWVNVALGQQNNLHNLFAYRFISWRARYLHSHRHNSPRVASVPANWKSVVLVRRLHTCSPIAYRDKI